MLLHIAGSNPVTRRNSSTIVAASRRRTSGPTPAR